MASLLSSLRTSTKPLKLPLMSFQTFCHHGSCGLLAVSVASGLVKTPSNKVFKPSTRPSKLLIITAVEVILTLEVPWLNATKSVLMACFKGTNSGLSN